jgi:protein-S-isoprenylcysteine O-methyltransferase Ste14
MHCSIVLALSLLVGSSSAFTLAPHQSSLVSHSRTSTILQAQFDNYNQDDENDLRTVINGNRNNDPLTMVQDLFENVKSFDWSSVSLRETAQAIQENAMSGELGQRGEAYFIAQLACLACIFGGGVPVVGSFLLLLCGPVLFVVGVAVVIISTSDMGSALSPWAVPPTDKGLITQGLYAQVRHPMYAGLLAACIGLAVVSDSVPRLVLTIALYLTLQAKSDLEEQALTDLYTTDYLAYKSQVNSKFVPRAVLDLLPWGQEEKRW